MSGSVRARPLRPRCGHACGRRRRRDPPPGDEDPAPRADGRPGCLARQRPAAPRCLAVARRRGTRGRDGGLRPAERCLPLPGRSTRNRTDAARRRSREPAVCIGGRERNRPVCGRGASRGDSAFRPAGRFRHGLRSARPPLRLEPRRCRCRRGARARAHRGERRLQRVSRRRARVERAFQSRKRVASARPAARGAGA